MQLQTSMGLFEATKRGLSLHLEKSSRTGQKMRSWILFVGLLVECRGFVAPPSSPAEAVAAAAAVVRSRDGPLARARPPPLLATAPASDRTAVAETKQQKQQEQQRDQTAHAFASPDGTVFVSHERFEDDDDDEGITVVQPAEDSSLWEKLLSTYLGPRAVLLVLAAFYASNFPLGSIMNDALPAAASTTGRMVLAALALAPAVPRLKPELRLSAVLCGFFTATGYIAQSLALVDTDPARVSFLGSATVLWCPMLEWLVNRRPMGIGDAPQTWLAAVLCLAGVGVLELAGISVAAGGPGWGDALALLQAAGFGTGVFWTSRMLAKEPDQALPVTATLIATTAFLSMLWSFADGWMFSDPDWMTTLAVPGLFLHPSVVAGAIVWTGLVSTSLTFWVELMALGRVPPSEASVLLASEPLWAALFAAVFLGGALTVQDAAGGALIVSACLVNALLTPSSFGLGKKEEQGEASRGHDTSQREHT
jgi:drug/metabolite transporter (DMT)-like permease